MARPIPKEATSQTNVRLGNGLKSQLQRIADADRRSLSCVIAIALEEFVERHTHGKLASMRTKGEA